MLRDCFLQEFDFLNVFGEAENALNLSQMVKSLEPDVFLMDLGLPELNGIEATKAIRMLDRLDALTIPIIGMTANAYKSDIDLSISVGMNSHLSKPIDSKLLLKEVNKYLKGEKI